jgi:O-antigen/teichoic acid export membrane protein
MNSQAPALNRASSLRQPLRLLASVLSLRYLLLRASTAGFAVVAGLVQTFVFARVLTPQDFSIFILIGTFGVSLWLFDLGAAKIVFVRQRARHLAQIADRAVTDQSTAIVLLYGLLVLAGTVLCFAVMAMRPAVMLWEAVQLALFFCFSALNLVWFPLRNVSNAIDEYITFETLEAVRRVGHIGAMLALLIGLPLPAFLLLVNLLWAAVFAICIAHLVRRRALTRCRDGFWSTLKVFWHANKKHLLRSGNYAVGELVVYNFPYFVVPLVFGLGAPTIILDTVFKVFRGATLIYAAGLDPLVPKQTRAFAEHDAPTLKKATLTATVLCAVPTLLLCAVLLFAGDRLFALLLDRAATVPGPAVFILVVLLVANMAQNVASNLLLHTGFFRQIARVATFLVIAMAAMTATVIVAGLDITGFLAGYTVVYIAGASLYISYVMRGPFRVAAQPKVARA